MANYKIKCVAVEVRTESEIWPGSARCKKDESYMLTARTPEPAGMCGRAFAAIHPMAFGMIWTDGMEWEKTDFVASGNIISRKEAFPTYGLSL